MKLDIIDFSSQLRRFCKVDKSSLLFKFILESEWNDECIDFTKMCVLLFFFLFFLCLCTR